jgi:anti-sigma regulatory factor (Ser/Thr protein kinase)
MLGDTSVAARTARRAVWRFHSGNHQSQWPDALTMHEVLLVVSELVTNSLMHASSTPQLVVWHEPPAGLCIEVSDPVATMPLPRDPTNGQEGGRGLGIVALVAADWGVDSHPGDGKTVWATFGTAHHTGR